ncbi:MAG: porin family protein [Muribaculaceae bacterium]|nr:porin family protein [Muribaculaceae bacterium]
MKTFHKSLLVALVAIFSFGYASADFRFGVKAGLNFNKLNYKIQNWQEATNELKNIDNQTGWMAGVMAEFTIPIVNIGADASILYARQNLTAKEKEYYSNENFIDIPVNLKWKIGLPVVGKFVSPIIYTGPDFLFALNKNTLKDIQTKTCEVGWNVGIGVELLRHLQIEAGYCFGLNNVMKYTNMVTGDLVNQQDLKAKKNYWTVTAAYLF